jgi:phage I-like protein
MADYRMSVCDAAAGGDEREVAVLRSAELAGAGDVVPREVLVAPWGVVESVNGTFVVDDEGSRLVIAAFEAQGTELPIDYEHQTLGGGYASPTGQAPAAGWIKRLWVRTPDQIGAAIAFHPPCPRLLRGGEGDAASGEAALQGTPAKAPGLYADVEWTEPAKTQLAARQYRYLSPVAIVRKSDRRLVALHSAALTNKPAIVGMRPIVNKEDLTQRRGDADGLATMDCGSGIAEGVRGCVGRSAIRNPQSAMDETGVSRLEDDRMTEVLDRLRGQLGLEAQSDGAAVLVAASERLSALMEETQRREAEARVVAAMEAGKLTEGQREWAVALAMKDAAAFEAWEASAPVVVQVGRIDGAGGTVGAAAVGGDRDQVVIAAKARAEFRANPELELLTSEEAYVALALRER